MKCEEIVNFPSSKNMKNVLNLLTAANVHLLTDCLNVLKENMRNYFQYLLLVQSTEEARKEKEEKKRYLIRKVIYIDFTKIVYNFFSSSKVIGWKILVNGEKYPLNW